MLIVDDERPARDTLKCLIQWELTPFKIVSSAKNGKEALEKYHEFNPNLIITDIKMPIMDGISLIKEIRKKDSTQKFVILSCYQEFNYAKEAISMGVTDYLIKDLIEAKDLYKVLEKVEKELSHDSFLHISKYSALREIMFNNLMETEVCNYIERFSLDLKGKNHVIMLIHVDDYKLYKRTNKEKWGKIKAELLTHIQGVLKNHAGGEVFYYKDGQFLATVAIEQVGSRLHFITKCHDIANDLSIVKIEEKLSLTICVSNYFSKIINSGEKYYEAAELLNYKLFVGRGKILLYDNIRGNKFKYEPKILDNRLATLEKAIKKNDLNESVFQIKELYQKELNYSMGYSFLREVNGKIYQIIMKICSNHNIELCKLFQVDYIPLTEIEELETIGDISSYFIDKVSKLIELKLRAENGYSRRVRDVIEFILSNYSADISLQEIAEKFQVHKVYLSRQFKDETGETLTEFIYKVRINNAKDLIKSGEHLLYEIAVKVGFKNPQQFSMIFKRYTGKTPAEFRESF